MPEFEFNPQGMIDSASGAILGLALGGINDRRQVRQAERLQNLQIKGAKEMTDYQKMKELQMWKDTNYGPQVEQMNIAGINPGLLYGMKGGGATTTGGGAASVQGQTAPAGGREIQDLLQQNIQRRLLQAQEENIRADTELKKTNAAYTAGAQTEATTAQTSLLAQELDNRREDFQIKRLQQTMMQIENFEKQASQEDRLQQIETATQTAMRQLRLIENQGSVSDATIQDQITIIQQNAIAAALQNEATQNNIQLTKEQIKKVTQEIVASKTQLSLAQLETMFKTNFPNLGQTAGRIFNDAIEAIYKLTAGQRTPHNQPKK